jgi:hypothetical protein
LAATVSGRPSRQPLILFIALPETQNKAILPLELLPRRCPLCGDDTIIGHGRGRKQAHDQCHDWIWVRRGICHPCSKTFTIVPVLAGAFATKLGGDSPVKRGYR